MGKVQQRILAALVATAVCFVLPASTLPGKKFYPDDPIWEMPKPLNVGEPANRKLSDVYDYFLMTFGKPGEKHTPAAPIPAGAVNTLGEVPNSLWYENRHGRKRMTVEELARGPGDESAPSRQGKWKIVGAKTEGVTPGFTIQDAKGRRYLLKFDGPSNYELVTAADVMGSKFFWAFGYYTPENYIVYFTPEQLTVKPGTKFVDHHGIERTMRERDISRFLEKVPRDDRNRLRAVASLYLEGTPIGAFRYHGTRADDPNDIVPHEHRRDLRGLRVFSAWVNHSDSKSLNSLDTIVKVDGVNAVRHHLIDFGAAFGTEAFTPKSPRAGHVYLLDWKDAALSFFTLGAYVPDWARADFEHVNGVGRLEAGAFRPDEWKGNYYNPAFVNCLPDDAFWAAKQIMRFTEAEIRALVATGRLSDKPGEEYLVRMLMERQQRIGQTYFGQVLPLDDFRVEAGKLIFEDLGVKYGFDARRPYSVSWSAFDNEAERHRPVQTSGTMQVPETQSQYIAAEISAGDPDLRVTVYLRLISGGHEVVGVERSWKRGRWSSGNPAADGPVSRTSVPRVN